MKKIIVVILLICMLMTGCGTNSSEVEVPEENEVTENPTPLIIETPQDAPGSTPALPEMVEADERLLDVEVTLPASLFSDIDVSTFDMDTYVKDNDFRSAVFNQDGSMTVILSKSRHKELLKELSEQLDKTFKEMIDAEDTPYIKSVTSNSDFSSVVIDVDREGYAAAFDLTPLLVAMAARYYQQFAGIEYRCEVIIRDVDTNETIKTVLYPDALE